MINDKELIELVDYIISAVQEKLGPKAKELVSRVPGNSILVYDKLMDKGCISFQTKNNHGSVSLSVKVDNSEISLSASYFVDDILVFSLEIYEDRNNLSLCELLNHCFLRVKGFQLKDIGEVSIEPDVNSCFEIKDE